MSVKTKIERTILDSDFENFSEKMIMKYLGFSTSFDLKQVRVVLDGMVEKGLIVQTNKHKYTILNDKRKGNQRDYIKGVLRGNGKGYAFLISDEESDLFIPHKSLNGAMHGDTVYVTKITHKNEKPEGKVVSILERGIQNVVGTFQKQDRFGFVVPDIKEFYNDIFIPLRLCRQAKNGDKVVAKINKYNNGKNPEGEIVEILGQSGNPESDVLSIIRSYGFYETIPGVKKEAQKIEKVGLQKHDLKNRDDFTDLLTITIDGDDSKDFDDAISLINNGKGYKLYVHIADVSHYVKYNSIIDKEAFKKATSVYFPSSVLPMIPEELSNGLCSLNEGEIRLTLTAIIELSYSGKVIGQEITESYIKSNHRMTYNNVTKILNGDSKLTKKYKDIVPMLKDMKTLAMILADKKEKRGAIDFGNDECKILLNDNLEVVDIVPYDYNVSNRIIEEFMILANETVAEFVCHAEYPFVYRVHENPNPEKLKNFADLANVCGFKFQAKEDINSYDFQKLLNEAKGTDYEKILSKVMLRTMQKAKYLTTNLGHFGLASKYYCHFTSPIRRYPDLTIHRVIKMIIEGKLNKTNIEKLEGICEKVATNSSEREIAAEQAERDADDYFKAQYMLDKVGNSYDGTISGVTQFGIFVELKNTVEGLIRFEDLNKDNYVFDEKRYSIIGTKYKYKLGDKIKITVASSDIEQKKVRFTLYKDVD